MDYWKNALIRGLRTGIQSALAVILASQAGFMDMDVLASAGIALVTALLSVAQNAIEDAPIKIGNNIPKG
jgi:hypothetical protein|tara:strand:+ start:221 stop:430 length:210 start_codon:yes stop_codon:yes gene_type:complete